MGDGLVSGALVPIGEVTTRVIIRAIATRVTIRVVACATGAPPSSSGPKLQSSEDSDRANFPQEGRSIPNGGSHG